VAFVDTTPVGAEPGPPEPYGGDGAEAGEGGDAKDAAGLTRLQRAAVAIDELYRSDHDAPTHWQDKPQERKRLRGQVRRLVMDLGLAGWEIQVPQAVEQYAVLHYRKP